MRHHFEIRSVFFTSTPYLENPTKTPSIMTHSVTKFTCTTEAKAHIILIERTTLFFSRTVRKTRKIPGPLMYFPAQLSLTSHRIRWPDEHTIQLLEVVVCFKSQRGTRHMPRVCVERRVRACSPKKEPEPRLRGWFNRLSRYVFVSVLFQVWRYCLV